MYSYDFLRIFNEPYILNTFMKSMESPFAYSDQKSEYWYHLDSFKHDVKKCLKSELPDDQDKVDVIATEAIHAYKEMAAPFNNFIVSNDLLHETSIARREEEFIRQVDSILEKEFPLERRKMRDVSLAILDAAKVDYCMFVVIVSRNDFAIVDLIDSDEILGFESRDGFFKFENNESDTEAQEQFARSELLHWYVTKRGYKQLLESEAVFAGSPMSRLCLKLLRSYMKARSSSSGNYYMRKDK